MTLKPKVAIITPGSFPIPSSQSSSVETVIEKLTATLQNEIEFSIFGRKSKELPFSEKSGNIRYIRIKFRKWTRYVTKINTILSDLTPHIIQIENRPKYVPLIRQMYPNIPILLSLHSTMYISQTRISKEALIHCMMLADKIIVNSQFLKKFIVNKKVCEGSKIFVNHLGVETNQFQSKWLPSQQIKSEAFKKKYGIEDKKILLFVGRLRKIKGVHTLLRALPSIINKVPDTVLIIAGGAFYGSERKTAYVDSLQTIANQFPENVKFISFIPHEEIHHWFQIADIVLVPSIGNEAFGLVNVEAMSCGVPVIATSIGGMPEIIEHDKTGFLMNLSRIEFELPEFILKLLNNPQKAKTMGENSIVRVHEQFTWEKCSNRLLGLYEDLMVQ